MSRKVKILDCTLRDGGYVNDWGFSNSQINKIVRSLECANIDIVELGYLDDNKGKGENSTLFNNLSSVDKILNNVPRSAKKVVMIDLFSVEINKIPKQSETKVDGIRLAFHKNNIEEALSAAKKIINLGYDLFFQPMITKRYTDEEFLSVIYSACQLDIYAFYIVDSFGSMSLLEFKHMLIWQAVT